MKKESEPLVRDAVCYMDGIHLTGAVVPLKRVKSAVLYAIEVANDLSDLESRGNTLEVLRKSFPNIFQELKLEDHPKVKSR